jgi:Flp pilus assembly pilin Flp
MINLLRTAIQDRKGVTAMEYAVIAAGIVIVIAVAADNAGLLIQGVFDKITPYLN